jgi:hypothetical protein
VCGPTGVLYYVSSTVNPILYNLISYRYRRAFADTLHCAGRRSSSLRRSTLSRFSCSTVCSTAPVKSTSFRVSLMLQQQHGTGRDCSCGDHGFPFHQHHRYSQPQQPQELQPMQPFQRGYSLRVFGLSTNRSPPISARLKSHSQSSTCCS